jgi:hypothetical protein
MLFSLIHTEIGSSSQFKLLAFEPYRLIKSLFGYHHLTLSLMEPFLRSNLLSDHFARPIFVRAAYPVIFLGRKMPLTRPKCGCA